jgi:hypothetical protein
LEPRRIVNCSCSSSGKPSMKPAEGDLGLIPVACHEDDLPLRLRRDLAHEVPQRQPGR